ncbi:PspA/IM30 family protein [Bacillus sp. DNRA2]|nr:PspA/IM30 family protein [Bacillus sp. DNRA2]NMD70491.1 PspA/IM30 family protein [Bacillus sp. DNRA2]
MGIFKRIKGIALADINNAIDKMEDPVSMLKQYLRDLEGEIEKAEQALSSQLFIEKKYELLIAESESVIEKRTRQAQLAVTRNEEEIAKLVFIGLLMLFPNWLALLFIVIGGYYWYKSRENADVSIDVSNEYVSVSTQKLDFLDEWERTINKEDK